MPSYHRTFQSYQGKKFKNLVTSSGFRFLAVLPELLIPIVIITQIWILLSIAIGIKETLNFRSNFKSIGVVVIVFLILFC